MAILLTYILRLTLNQRALYCYMLLSVWILILLGMYKYVTTESTNDSVLRTGSIEKKNRNFPSVVRPEIKNEHAIKFCNPHYSIASRAEGLANRNFSLEGVVIVMRHGDRGPLTHIKNISSINCAPEKVHLFAEYDEFMTNLSGSQLLSQLLGAFHGFPAVPIAECSLGQLTRYGALQLLTTGRLLGTVYGTLLQGITKKDVLAYSTRYRRTVQSALAFLYAFLTRENLLKVTLQEAQSLAFCFDDCACPAAEKYFNMFLGEMNRILKTRPTMGALVGSVAAIVFELPDRKIAADPHAVKDALLAYVCHGATLPCHDRCVTPEDVTSLFAYVAWEARQHALSTSLRHACLLRAYGLLRNIVSHLLRLVSEKRPRVVLYSGHDKTISFITTALGVLLESTAWPSYASRLIFEVYRSREDSETSSQGPVGSDYYFRLIFNGVDITSKVVFCKFENGLIVVNDGKSHDKTNTAFLCPIELIIRFLHEDYFSSFNTTNMKEACAL